MGTYNKEKHIATRRMMEALQNSHMAYFTEDTPLNLAAYHACQAALQEMLKPYYMNEEREETITP